jgi:pimeloyl-ACP methyl ester carboxylesterase
MTTQKSSHSTLRPVFPELTTRDGITLPLRHFAPTHPKDRTVLLLHGASASSVTFEVPMWNGGSRGIVDYLCMQGFDVWTLDWRGGLMIAGDLGYANGPQALTLDAAAEYDVPEAIAFIRARMNGTQLAVVGHCLGAAAMAMAIGAGFVTHRDVQHVVLTAIGLFYDVTWDGWVKADDQVLERSLITQPATRSINCNAQEFPWPTAMQAAYSHWPKALLPERPPEHPFARLTFMFGRPFLEGLVAQEDQTQEILRERFGDIPIALYIQAGQNVRRGFAAPYDDTSWGPATGAPRATDGKLDPQGAGKYMHVERFVGMRVTLMTGALNQLWHPDSIRRMYEWLKRDKRVQVTKKILPGYGHQDLYWAGKAPVEVYPSILDGIQ